MILKKGHPKAGLTDNFSTLVCYNRFTSALVNHDCVRDYAFGKIDNELKEGKSIINTLLSDMKIKEIKITDEYPVRAPGEHSLRLHYISDAWMPWVNGDYLDDLENAKEEPKRYAKIQESISREFAESIRFLHARGDSIAEIASRVDGVITLTKDFRLTNSAVYLAELGGPHSCDFISIALLLAPDQEALNDLSAMITCYGNARFYHNDVLLKAFIPEWQFGKPCSRTGLMKFHLAWADNFVKALISDDREPALEKYLSQYDRYSVATPGGDWKPWDEFKPEKDPGGLPVYGSANLHFAFHVALAVCAYDLDDTTFRDHPYYPHEIVDYYRNHIRDTRDSWRAHGLGAAVAIEPPPKGKKVDLAKSKSKNFKRWIELIADGDVNATKAVIETLGSLRKVKDIEAVLVELSDQSICANADLKDDATLESSLLMLLESRELSSYEIPVTQPAQGPGRCEQVLRHCSAWVSDKGYEFFTIDSNGDNWSGVLVQIEYVDEWLALSGKLGVKMLVV